MLTSRYPLEPTAETDMAHVVFLMHWEAGHLLCTFKAAQDLVSRGHRVTYATIPDLAGLVAGYGFAVVTILELAFPPGSREKRGVADRRRLRAQRLALHRAARAELVERRIQSISPDLVLVDRVQDQYFRSLNMRGISAALVTTSLPDEREGGLPPVTSSLVPTGSLRVRLATQLSWARVFVQRWWEYLSRRRPMLPPRLCRDYPEIVLCAEQFDFRRPKRARRYYVGPGIATQRPPQHFPWDAVDPNAKLIYCSLGTEAQRYYGREQVLRIVAAAVGGRCNRFLVITAEERVRRVLGKLPQNILVVDYAPQLELLRRAHVAICHAGLGTVKESILCGVPLLVFPQAFDQWGNAARVEYHGLGIRASGLSSPAGICALIDRLLADSTIHANVRRMQAVFQRSQAEDGAVRVIEEWLSGS